MTALPTKEEIASAKAESEAAERSLEKILAQRDRKIWELASKARAEIEEQVRAEFKAQIEAAQALDKVTRETYENARRVRAESGVDNPPVGMKVYRLDMVSHGLYHRFTPTYRVLTGQLEVVTPESKFPQNRVYGKPKVGDVIVRLHLKGDKTGLKYEDYPHGRSFGNPWSPEDPSPLLNKSGQLLTDVEAEKKRREKESKR